VVPPLLFTLSRGSYLAFFPAVIAMAWFAPWGRKIIPILILLVAVLSIPFMPDTVRRRVEYTFKGRTTYTLPSFGVQDSQVSLDKSSVARLQTWETVMGYWMQYPILGLGITGAGFIDSQWMRTVGELGLIGILAVIWLFRTVIANALRLYRAHYNRDDDLGFTIALGYLGGLVGLMIHAVTANTFYIVRIMGPFWFFTGLIVILQKFEAERLADETAAEEAPANPQRLAVL
ncbi:MAG TPA: O-antigen ligase family protein, partial [bacterium]|nr:O-antigen ligase family protein [bacterium]